MSAVSADDTPKATIEVLHAGDGTNYAKVGDEVRIHQHTSRMGSSSTRREERTGSLSESVSDR